MPSPVISASAISSSLLLIHEHFGARRKDSGKDFAHAIPKFDEPARFSGLSLERVSLPVHFRENIVHTGKILACRFETRLGEFPFRFELRNACGFFDQSAAVMRLGTEQLADASLFDDGVAVRTETCAEKNVLDVPKPARLSVEHVDAFTGPVQPALDHNVAWPGMMAIPIPVAVSIAIAVPVAVLHEYGNGRPRSA